METPASGVDAAVQQTVLSMSDAKPALRTVPPPLSNEIEIPLELVGCDERMPRTVDDARTRPRTRLTTSATTEGPLSPLQGPPSPLQGPLSPLHEEELTTSSSSSSSSQSTSPDDEDNEEDDVWTACCSDKLVDNTLDDCKLAASDPLTVDGRTLSSESNVEVMSGLTAVPAAAADWSTTGNRAPHQSCPGLTARLGNLLNSAVMKAQKQLGRGQRLQWIWIVTKSRK